MTITPQELQTGRKRDRSMSSVPHSSSNSVEVEMGRVELLSLSSRATGGRVEPVIPLRFAMKVYPSVAIVAKHVTLASFVNELGKHCHRSTMNRRATNGELLG